MLPSLTKQILMTFLLGVIFRGFGNDLQCPHPSQRKFRILSECNGNSSIYNCLFNTTRKAYFEFCEANQETRAGLKLVISGSFRNVKCSDGRYQPFTFKSNQSSDCSYLKSKCTETGQIISKLASTITDSIGDSNCRCDYRRNFAFISRPRNPCFCIPSEEDCSCYIKQCPNNTLLSPDYGCVSLESTNISFNCKPVTDWPINRFDIGRNTSYKDYGCVSLESTNISFNCKPVTDWPINRFDIGRNTSYKGRNMNLPSTRPGITTLTVMILASTLFAGALLILFILANYNTGNSGKNIGIMKIVRCNIKNQVAYNGNLPEMNQDKIKDKRILYDKKVNKQKLESKKSESKHNNFLVQQKRNQSDHLSSVVTLPSAANLKSPVLNSKKEQQTKFNTSFESTINDSSKGKSCLMDACSKGNVKMVNHFIQKGTNINITNRVGQTLLYQSCVIGNIDIVKLLIDTGCDVDKTDNEGRTPLMASCRHGHLPVVEYLISITKGVDIDISDNRGKSALYWSCFSGKDDIVNFLIGKGCDWNKPNIKLETPLMSACCGGWASTVRLLIDIGVDINSADKEGRTAMYWSCSSPSPGTTDVLSILIKNGSDIKKPNKNGETPLMAACCKCNLSAVKQLIETDAGINIADEEGNTPLYWSCFGGNIDIVNELVKKKCDIDKPNKFGTTPFMTACCKEHSFTVKLLIEKGANKNIRDNEGYTALHLCCLYNKSDMVTLLMANGCDKDKPNNNGETPIMTACINGDLHVVRKLINEGAIIENTDIHGRTLLEYATEGGNSDIVDLLITKQSDNINS